MPPDEIPETELTETNPQIGQLADYYRTPYEKREQGEGLMKRLLRIGLTLATSSKEDYDKAQQAKEKLFAANVELNRLKEVQKMARMALELSTKEADDRMKSSQQKRKLAEEADKRFQQVYEHMTEMEKKAAAGTPEWATPGGQEGQEAETDAKRAYADYLRSGGRGGKGLVENRMLEMLNKYQSGARTATKGREEGLDTMYKELTSPETLQPLEALGRYASFSADAMAQLQRDSQPADIMGNQTPSTVQSGKIPQHYGTALAGVRKFADEAQVSVPWGVDKPLAELLRDHITKIRQMVGPQQPEAIDSALMSAIRDMLPRLTGEAESFVRGAGGPDEAAVLIFESLRPALLGD